MTLFKKIAHIYRTLLKGAVAIQAAVLIAAAPAFASQTEAPKGHDFTVVIDAGHGGHDHGAIDNGVREKDINLAVAKDLADLIKKKLKDVKVVMTRYDDTFISLQGRYLHLDPYEFRRQEQSQPQECAGNVGLCAWSP